MNLKMLKPLVMMQLKDKIDLTFLKSTKQTIFKIVFSLLGFALITAIVYLLFFVGKMVYLFSVISIIPVTVIVVAITVMVLLSILSCTYGLMKTLYFSPDNPVLLTLPVKPISIFASKLIVFYFYEIIKNLSYMLPVLVAYGISCGYALYFYPWVILMIFLISAIPVVIGALLSIPAMWISQFLKQYKFLQIFLLVIVISVVIYLIFYTISLIPSNINLIARWGYISNKIYDFLEAFGKIFLPFTWLTTLLVGKDGLIMVLFSVNTIYILLGVIALLLVCGVLTFVIAKPLFLKMASKPFEYKKKIIKKTKINKKHNVWLSALKIELFNNFRTPQVLYSTIAVFFSMPIAIFFFNKILSAMNTRLLGQYLTYSFAILIMLLILLTSNSILASAYSKEGLSGPLNKTRPVNCLVLLLSKTIWQAVFSTLSIIFTAIIFELTMPIGINNIILLAVSLIFINLAGIFWSAEYDFMKPLYQQYATFGASANNPNEKKATITAFIIAFMVFGIYLFFMNESLDVAFVKVLFISIAFLAIRIYLFTIKAKIFYKEII